MILRGSIKLIRIVPAENASAGAAADISTARAEEPLEELLHSAILPANSERGDHISQRRGLSDQPGNRFE